MTITVSGIHDSNAASVARKADQEHKLDDPSRLSRVESQISIGAGKNPTELILQSAMKKINEMFAPHLGDRAIEYAAQSGQDMGPETTAQRILSYASLIIGRAENEQVDLPVEEQRSREQLFNNIKVGIERGFEQSRNILEGMQALNGDVKETVNSTYDYVQQGLAELALLLGLQPPEQSQA
ncbi:MAG: hypothetical protein AUJ57_02155 [Zetaproteobacteria bacterium CG1_02_53_45]|nr:MAG: hypothetical protein AUJ57_02155 [Zetaproteobacteria bacterium CG1_02_53_45]